MPAQLINGVPLQLFQLNLNLQISEYSKTVVARSLVATQIRVAARLVPARGKISRATSVVKIYQSLMLSTEDPCCYKIRTRKTCFRIPEATRTSLVLSHSYGRGGCTPRQSFRPCARP